MLCFECGKTIRYCDYKYDVILCNKCKIKSGALAWLEEDQEMECPDDTGHEWIGGRNGH